MNTSSNFRIMKERGQLSLPEKKDFSAAAFVGLAKKKRDDSLVSNRNDLIVYFFNSLPDSTVATIPDSLDNIKDTDEKKYHGVLENLIFDKSIVNNAKNTAASILCSWLIFDTVNGTDTKVKKESKELNRIKGAELLVKIFKLKIDLQEELKNVDAFNIIKDFIYPSFVPDKSLTDVVKNEAARAIKNLAKLNHPVAFETLSKLFFTGDWLPMNFVEGFKWLILAKLYLPEDKKSEIGNNIDGFRVKYGSDSFNKGMDEATKLHNIWENPPKPMMPSP